MIFIPISFAESNDTQSGNDDIIVTDSQTITKQVSYENNIIDDSTVNFQDVYFNASVSDDTGDGSIYSPYQKLSRNRIVNNSILHFASGEYKFSNTISIANVTIQGQSTNDTIISGGHFKSNELFTIENITLKGTQLTNNGSLILNNSKFKDSTSNIYSQDGILSIYDCNFTNYTDNNGGVIYCSNNILDINNSYFNNNNANVGGVLCSINSNITITNTIFTQNNANITGGALTLLNTTSTIRNATFTNNTAKYYGGVIHALKGSFEIEESQLEYNNAYIASTLYLDEITPLRIYSNKFKDNNATGNATIYITSSTSKTIEENIFTNNTSGVSDIIESELPNTDITGGNITLIQYESSYNQSLPESYDLRDYGYVTSVKNQYSNGNCWAFAALASLESCILKATNQTYDFSEANMKNLMSLYSDYGWNILPNDGGSFAMATGYLTSWLGPVNEDEDEYIIDSVISPVITSNIHVQNILFLYYDNNTADAIKEAILKYGAVATSINWDFSYAKGSTYYYPGNGSSNHGITIVGWDDTYSKENFKQVPESDGAWIIKNSWGTNSGDDGYYYVSYYDTTIARDEFSFTFILNDTISFDNNYQYDIPGRTDYFLNDSSTVWYKNTYTAKSDEYITGVSTYFQKQTNYTVSIYVNNVLVTQQDASTNTGYYTLILDNPVYITSNDTFQVEYKITTDNQTGVPISEIYSLNKLYYKENISFISYDGINWQDFYSLEWEYPGHFYDSQVASIKAFTVNRQANIQLSATNTTSCQITANIKDQYNNTIITGTLTITIDEEEVTINNSNGTIILTDELTIGQHTIIAEFNENNITMQIQNITINITTDNIRRQTTITINQTQNDNTLNITATIKDSNGQNVNNGKVVLKINGKTIKNETTGKVIYLKVTDGIVNLSYEIPISWNNKTINITAVYSGSTKYYSSRNSTTYTIEEQKPILTITAPQEAKANTNVTLNAKVTANNNVITTGKIVFKINGKTLKDSNGKVIYLNVDQNGEVTANYNIGNLKTRSYTLTAVFISSIYERIETTTTFNVVK